MVSSEVDIVNSALAKVGNEPITSLLEDTKSARICNQEYKKSRDFVFAEHPWNCLQRRLELAPEIDAPAWGYEKRFLLPGDWISTTWVGQGDLPCDYIEEGGALLANGDTLQLIYTARIELVTLYPSYLVESIANRLAYQINFPLSQNKGKTDTLLQVYRREVAQAKYQDSRNDPSQILEVTDYIVARYSGITARG